jgi:uncharacterized membrane protein
MKTLNSPDRKKRRYKYATIYGLVGALILFASAKGYVPLTVGALFVVLAPIFASFDLVVDRLRHRAWGDIIEDVAIGRYEPEDERDFTIKSNASMAAFRVMMFMAWVVVSVYYYEIFMANPGQSVDPTPFLIAILIGLSGMITYHIQLRKDGIEIDGRQVKGWAKEKELK